MKSNKFYLFATNILKLLCMFNFIPVSFCFFLLILGLGLGLGSVIGLVLGFKVRDRVRVLDR